MSCLPVEWRGCPFKNQDNAQSNPRRDRKVEKATESENRKRNVIKGGRLSRKGRKREEVLLGHQYLR